MASNFISEDFETSDELPKDNGFILEVYETNYHFEKRFAVHGYNTVGQLILFIVQEIGKSFFHIFWLSRPHCALMSGPFHQRKMEYFTDTIVFEFS